MKTVLCYLNGQPDFEALYPLLARLNKRGNIRVEAKIRAKLIAQEPRISACCEMHEFWPKAVSKFAMKFLYRGDYLRADAVLTLNDPLWEQASRRHRANLVRKHQKKSIFVQHGVYQLAVNAPRKEGLTDYYSQLLLFWEWGTQNEVVLSEDAQNRVQTSGFLKAPVLDTKQIQARWAARLAKYRKVVLVCQSFKWAGDRFDVDSVTRFYALLDQFLSAHPDIFVILRSHRGKTRRNHKSHDNDLKKKFANISFSQSGEGELGSATIQDALSISDCLISPVSTTVLDAAFMNKPVAIWDEGNALFPELTTISTLDHFSDFVLETSGSDAGLVQLQRRFGKLDENLDKAAAQIERFMQSAQ